MKRTVGIRAGSRSRRPRNSADRIAVRLAAQLLALRGARGETQKQVALRLGMTESMVSRLESGQHVPNIATLCRIADGFDRSLEIAFHEHEHTHADGTRHTHAHDHRDPEHRHDHGSSA